MKRGAQLNAQQDSKKYYMVVIIPLAKWTNSDTENIAIQTNVLINHWLFSLRMDLRKRRS